MRLLVVALIPVLVGCATTPPPKVGPPKAARTTAQPLPRAKTRLVMEPIRLQAVKGGPGTQVKVVDAAGLFERAGQLLSAKRYREAIKLYDQLLTEFPKSRYVSPALYNAGLCHEWLGQFARAAERYKALVAQFGATREAVDAGFRLGGCLAETRNWAASAQVFQVLLGRSDLSASDRIEAYARKGLAHFRLGDARAAKSTLQEGLRYHKSIEAVERLDSDFFLAMIHYYLAALPHVEFRKLTLDGSSKSLGQVLNEKAKLLIESQAGYIKTIKVKNPYWATASGFQVGSIYREFYNALLSALPDFSEQAKQNARKAKIPLAQARKQLVQVYLEEVHKAVKPLLHKAIRVFERNVEMASRVGVQSNWVGKSRRQIQDLKLLLSLSPKKAVELARQEAGLPEDQPAAPSSAPSSAPSGAGGAAAAGGTPTTEPANTPPKQVPGPADLPEPPQPDGDQPGRVVL